jgi:hypothetical protein
MESQSTNLNTLGNLFKEYPSFDAIDPSNLKLSKELMSKKWVVLEKVQSDLLSRSIAI